MASRNMHKTWQTILGAYLTALLAASVAPGAADNLPAWWNDSWSHRQIIEIISPDPKGSINTALVSLETDGKAAPDGRDIRVVCPEGGLTPHEIVERDGDIFSLQFKVEPETLIYQVYYGNQEASDEKHDWEKKLGGLHLKTMRNDARGPAWNLRQMRQMIEQSGHVFGEGPRPNIDDGYNPFGDDDFYLSVYRGALFFPEDGKYIIASNSDDSSFVLINGNLVLSVPGGNAPTITWEHTAEVELTRGIHQIEYLHVEVDGGQLSRAGWQTPSAKSIVTIPPRYFVRELIAESIARESRKKNVNAFFSYEKEAGRVFNRNPRVFTPVNFQDRSNSTFGDIAIREWDFGDGGPPSHEEAPSHEFNQAGEYEVTLRVWNEYGLADECVRKIKVGERRPERIGLYLDVVAGPPILEGNEPVEISARHKTSALEEIPVVLRVKARDVGGNLLHWSREETQSLNENWNERSFLLDYPVTTGSISTLEYNVSLQLLYCGVIVAERNVRVVPASRIHGRLTLTDQGLVDQNDNHVLLRIGFGQKHRVESLNKTLRNRNELKLMVIDDHLSPHDAEETESAHYRVLARMLEERHPGASVSITRIDASIFHEYPPLERIGLAPQIIAEAEPDITLIGPGIQDLLSNLPEEKYEQHLQALAERIIISTAGQIVLITPPPMLIQHELSRRYAYATKRVATRLNLPVADAYSAFMILERPWRELYRNGRFEDEVYYLWPCYEGQIIIGERIYGALFPDANKSRPGLRNFSQPGN